MIIYIPYKVHHQLDLNAPESLSVEEKILRNVMHRVLQARERPEHVEGYPSLFKVRGNDTARFIFRRLTDGWVLLDILRNHEYEDLKQIAERRIVTDDFLFANAQTLKGTMYTLNHVGEIIQHIEKPLIAHRQELLMLSDAQTEALKPFKDNSITVLYGEAGSGKTSLLEHRIIELADLLSQDASKALSITLILPSTQLKKAIEADYTQHHRYQQQIQRNDPLSVLTPWDLITRNKHYNAEFSEADSETFLLWYQTIPPVKLLHEFNPSQLYSELAVIFALTHYAGQTEGKAKYLEQSFARCVLPLQDETQRGEFFDKLNGIIYSYQLFLLSQKKIDPTFYHSYKQCPTKQTYVFLDEAQNTPPVLLLSLLERMKGEEKHLPLTIAMNASQSLAYSPFLAETFLAFVEKDVPTEYLHLPGTHRCPEAVRNLYGALCRSQEALAPSPKRPKTAGQLTGLTPTLGACFHVPDPSPDQKTFLTTLIQQAKAAVILCHGTQKQFYDYLELPPNFDIPIVVKGSECAGLQFPIIIVVNLVPPIPKGELDGSKKKSSLATMGSG